MDVILSLTWSSAYQSVRGLVLHFAAAWRQAGFDFIELDISAQGWDAKLRQLLTDRKIRFVFCTSGIGTNLQSNRGALWDQLKIPVYSLLLDHPAYFAQHHRTQPKNTVLSYMFRDHALFQSEFVQADNIVTSIDFGIPDLPMRPVPELLANGRPRIIFAKSGNAPEALAANWRNAPQLEHVLHDTLDILALTRNGHANVPAFLPAITRAAQANRIELQPFSLLARYLTAQIDDYIRRLKSTAIARAILNFEADVFGRGWDHIDTSNARARFHGGVDYATLEAEFPNATASLTMNPNINLSAHDRFFTALGAGIMPLSDSNAYAQASFPELAPYSYDFTPGSIESAIERVLANPQTALETARAARTRARPALGTEQTAAAILQTMQTAGFLYFQPKSGQDFFVP